MAVMALPEKYRKRLRTTNMQERLNEEIRRRERVIRIFPNDASALRLIGAFLAEKTRSGRRRNTSIWTRSKIGRPPDPPPDKATTSWFWPAKNNGIYQITLTAKKGLDLPTTSMCDQDRHVNTD